MQEIALWRIHLLRVAYLMLVVFLGRMIWPAILHHAHWELMHGVADCLLGAMSLVAVIGLRYPLQMLPLLFFELAWKTIWLIVVAYPAWAAHNMDADTADTTKACLMAVIFIVLIPWDYVWRHYAANFAERAWCASPYHPPPRRRAGWWAR